MISTDLLSTYLMSTTILSTESLVQETYVHPSSTHRNSCCCLLSTELLSTYLMSTPISCPRNSCPSIFIHIETHLLPVSNPCNSPSPISHPPNAHPQDHKTSPNTSKLIFYQSPICCEKLPALGKAEVFSIICKIIKKKDFEFCFRQIRKIGLM